MCEVKVDAACFPAVHTWLGLVTATQPKGRDRYTLYIRFNSYHHAAFRHRQESAREKEKLKKQHYLIPENFQV
jgi:hypothetical protein